MVKLPISLPYTADWENPDGQDGLVQDGDEFYNIVHQQYANDTLYTLLKTNQNARARFVDLAEQLQQLNDEQAVPKNPLSQLLKLLKDRLKTYLPPGYQLAQPHMTTTLARATFASVPAARYRADLAHTTPPPER